MEMKLIFGVVLVAGVFGFSGADSPPSPVEPYVGDWNFSTQHLCIKLHAGIRLDIIYNTHNGTKPATIESTKAVVVNESSSVCGTNASADINETLALDFGGNRKLNLYFTRDPRITEDKRGIRWQLHKLAFQFDYDNATFPDSETPGHNDVISNDNSTLGGIATSIEHSFGCSRTGPIVVNNRMKISFTQLRVQAYMTTEEFSAADHCAADQESTDLIPIIIGAALAALVIIVLVAYLIGRARANTPTYDNMK